MKVVKSENIVKLILLFGMVWLHAGIQPNGMSVPTLLMTEKIQKKVELGLRTINGI